MFQSNLIKSVLLVMLVAFLIVGISCSDESTDPPQPGGGADLTVTNFTDCKSSVGKIADGHSIQECIEWQYTDGVLSIHHVNAGFNCCVTALLAGFDKDGNQITIAETEDLEYGGCSCLCLYDIDYRISYLAADEYTFTVSGPYMGTTATPESDYLTFSIDLTSDSSGSYCVDRDHYPW